MLDGVGDFPRKVLLDLQAPGEHVDDARQLRQAKDLAGRNIGHMGLADKGQQVMLAQRIQLDVLEDHHLVVVGSEQRTVDDFLQVLLVPMTQILHGLGSALWRVEQTFALGVFTQALEDLAVVVGQG